MLATLSAQPGSSPASAHYATTERGMGRLSGHVYHHLRVWECFYVYVKQVWGVLLCTGVCLCLCVCVRLTISQMG